MANLLPLEALASVRRSHIARFILVGSLTAIICGGIALLTLVPLYVIVRVDEVTEGAGTGDRSITALGETDQEDIIHAQKLVWELRPIIAATSSVMSILDAVLTARPNGVIVLSVSYVRGEPGTIVLRGQASSRDAINAYRTSVAKDLRFKNVSVPINDLTSAEDGHFTMTLTGTF